MQGRGESIGSSNNNLVYTKRQKDIYLNSTHETTKGKKVKTAGWFYRRRVTEKEWLELSTEKDEEQ